MKTERGNGGQGLRSTDYGLGRAEMGRWENEEIWKTGKLKAEIEGCNVADHRNRARERAAWGQRAEARGRKNALIASLLNALRAAQSSVAC